MDDRVMCTGALVGALLLGACGNDPLLPAPEEVLPFMEESPHGVYYSSHAGEVDVEDQEAYYLWLFDRWGVVPDEPLVYFKYRNRAHMLAVTGQNANGWAEPGIFRFHTIWPVDNHESVHAYVTSVFGLPPSLINEGLAVAHQAMPPRGSHEPHWGDIPIDSLAARHLRAGAMPPLESLLTSRDFERLDPEITYPVAGSFARFLLHRHGYERMKTMVRAGGAKASATTIRANFRAAFGQEIDVAWRAWLRWLADEP